MFGRKQPQIDTDPQKIDAILQRGVHEVFGGDELRKKLLSGKQLHLKLGTDVTGPQLHLGHAVVHRKIRDFQELGHKVTLIIGDFTTLVGDHSDKVDMRAETNTKEIKKNEATFKQQFFKTVHNNLTTIRHNSEWLKKLSFADVVELTRLYTVQQMFDRETFKIRYKNGNPIGLDEWLYPLMQGYDSVALNCDLEFGGTDQTFNLLAGRRLMEHFKQDPQSAMVMKLLVGSDGRPMGKSLQNFIPIDCEANDMYGKVMSITDAVIWDYFELVTRVPISEIQQMKQQVAQGENPMQFKHRLAHEIVSFYHSEADAESAKQHFSEAFQQQKIPTNTKTVKVKLKMPLADILIKQGLVKSKSEFRRLVEEGAIKFKGQIEEKKIVDPQSLIEESGAIKIGKRRFLKLTVTKETEDK